MNAELTSLKTTYVRKAKRAMLTKALRSGYVSIDDVREVVPFPTGLNPKLNGEIPDYFRRLGILVGVTHQNSRRKIAHSRPVMLWRLIDRSQATRWLTQYPDLPWPDGAKPTDGQLRLFPQPNE